MTHDHRTRLLAEIEQWGCTTGKCVHLPPTLRCSREALASTLRAVVELHAPHTPFVEAICSECNGAHGEDYPWPCSTIETIADQLGVTDGPTGATPRS